MPPQNGDTCQFQVFFEPGAVSGPCLDGVHPESITVDGYPLRRGWNDALNLYGGFAGFFRHFSVGRRTHVTSVFATVAK